MHRFKTGEAVFILPKFAKLYPTETGVVKSIETDPFRPMFNEYIIDFSDGSSACLFEFQLLESPREYQTVIARMASDSETGGRKSIRRIVFRTHDMEIEAELECTRTDATISGRVLHKETGNVIKNAEVRLLRGNEFLFTSETGDSGTFAFEATGRGPLNLLAVIPRHQLRIFAGFTA